MRLILVPGLAGTKIITDTNDQAFLYRFKLFSLSSTLLDENGREIAALKRSGWWHLSFTLTTEDGEYDLLGKWGEFSLTSSNTGEIFKSYSSNDFYSTAGVRVTELSPVNCFRSRYRLVIHTAAHTKALLMASSLLYRLAIEA